MKKTSIIEKSTAHLQAEYLCHTVILYGSYARNDASNTSDIDMIGIRNQGEFRRDCQMIEGHYLDAFIYDTNVLDHPDTYLIRIREGIVLTQKDFIGDMLLAKVQALYQSGPTPTPEWEKHEIQTWLVKMLERSKINDLEGNFRRHWLLHDVLECYFKLRDQWYLGPKESFAWLLKHDIATYHAFQHALTPLGGY